MAKRKENKETISFRKTTSDNYDEVQEWPKWKQEIIISSATASTGRFTKSKSRQKKKSN